MPAGSLVILMQSPNENAVLVFSHCMPQSRVLLGSQDHLSVGLLFSYRETFKKRLTSEVGKIIPQILPRDLAFK